MEYKRITLRRSTPFEICSADMTVEAFTTGEVQKKDSATFEDAILKTGKSTGTCTERNTFSTRVISINFMGTLHVNIFAHVT